MAQANPYPLRVERTIFEKFKVVARENGRSVNKELEMTIKMAICERYKYTTLVSLCQSQSELFS